MYRKIFLVWRLKQMEIIWKLRTFHWACVYKTRDRNKTVTICDGNEILLIKVGRQQRRAAWKENEFQWHCGHQLNIKYFTWHNVHLWIRYIMRLMPVSLRFITMYGVTTINVTIIVRKVMNASGITYLNWQVIILKSAEHKSVIMI